MSVRTSIRSMAVHTTALRSATLCATRAYTCTYTRPTVIPPIAHSRLVQVRAKTTSPNGPNKWAKNPVINYDELKPITEQPNDDILLIDVREPDEVALGSIPSAVNLPLSVLKESLSEQYSTGDFQRKFAFPKPAYNQNIIFFCRSGKRSATAAEQAAERGYPNIRNYTGSWLDWQKKEQARDGGDD
ncbi:Rhodanese-like domain-containing protein [Naematelia encephala]|uniref:Rhodanese-like domain-containing protein n=1 Tax=Naematelia encephala TaxID=71784 RepID=A0A1Y2B2E6_9TREE|nr:Rhodanese-like domain-containing protein [Naematelia encephala]